jgi:hypothetical protein
MMMSRRRVNDPSQLELFERAPHATKPRQHPIRKTVPDEIKRLPVLDEIKRWQPNLSDEDVEIVAIKEVVHWVVEDWFQRHADPETDTVAKPLPLRFVRAATVDMLKVDQLPIPDWLDDRLRELAVLYELQINEEA